MNRRAVVIGSAAWMGSISAASAAAPSFTSDRITVVVEGQGPDVILIPGLTSSRAVFQGLVDHMKGRYRFHRVQLNGFAGAPAGGNAKGPVAAPVAEEIARYITSAGLNKPAVIGHSMGGTMAMMLAARHPQLPGRVMVVDMSPFMALVMLGPTATPQTAAPLAAQMRQGMASAPAEAFHKQQDETIAGMVKTESARPAIIQQARDSDRDVAARAMEELITTDLRPELSKITAPMTVLYVWTPQYPISAEQLDAGYKAMYAPVKGVRLIRIPDSYHFIMIDQPQRFEAEVTDFLHG